MCCKDVTHTFWLEFLKYVPDTEYWIPNLVNKICRNLGNSEHSDQKSFSSIPLHHFPHRPLLVSRVSVHSMNWNARWVQGVCATPSVVWLPWLPSLPLLQSIPLLRSLALLQSLPLRRSLTDYHNIPPPALLLNNDYNCNWLQSWITIYSTRHRQTHYLVQIR